MPWQPASSAPSRTKSFTCQLAVLYLLALYEGARLGRMNANTLAEHILELQALPAAIEASSTAGANRRRTRTNTSRQHLLYLGRGIHYAIAREGALKLKEASTSTPRATPPAS